MSKITTKNYFEKIKGLDFSKLPEAIQEGAELTFSVSENNWEAYQDKDIKEVVDLYFEKLEAYLPKEDVKTSNSPNFHERPKVKITQSVKAKKTTQPKVEPKPKAAAKPKVEPNPKAAAKPKAKTKPKTAAKPKATAKPKAEPKPKERQAYRVMPIAQWAKRYLAMDGKPVQKEKLVNLLQAIQKGIAQRVVTQNTKNGECADFLQLQVLGLLQTGKFGKKLIIEPDAKEMIQSVANVKESIVVKLLKRYINLADSKMQEAQGAKLVKDIEKAIAEGTASPKHKLYAHLVKAYERASSKNYTPTAQMLSGLKGI